MTGCRATPTQRALRDLGWKSATPSTQGGITAGCLVDTEKSRFFFLSGTGYHEKKPQAVL